MRALIQRSKESSVLVKNKIVAKIDKGMVILLGINVDDNEEDIDYIVKKIINLRIFDDENGIMNDNIIKYGGQILLVSQFTLQADTKKGNRPSYIKAKNNKLAETDYLNVVNKLKNFVDVKTGIFGEDMNVLINNDGPVTILIDSKNK